MGGGDPMDADAARTRLVDFYQPTKQRAQTKICKRRSGLGEAKRKAKGRAQSAEAEGSLSLSLSSCFLFSSFNESVRSLCFFRCFPVQLQDHPPRIYCTVGFRLLSPDSSLS